MAERAQGRLLCASPALLSRCVSLCVCAVYWFWDRAAALHPGPSCSLSEHPTRRQDDVFRLFAIDLKKKKKSKTVLCSKTWRERCWLQRDETSSSISVPDRRQHILLHIQEYRLLHRHCSGLHCYYHFVEVMQLLCPPPTAHRPPLSLPLVLAGGPPSALPLPPLTVFVTLPSTLGCSDAGSLWLLGH